MTLLAEDPAPLPSWIEMAFRLGYNILLVALSVLTSSSVRSLFGPRISTSFVHPPGA